jgi:hypothetical protein
MNGRSIALRPVQFGLSLAIFLLIAYVACLASAIVVPDAGLHAPWLQFFPGFAWTPVGMLIGAVESLIYGFLSGIVFAPIANFFDIARTT